MENTSQKIAGLILLITTYVFVVGVFAAHAALPVKRIAILPISSEPMSNELTSTDQGVSKKADQSIKHSRRTIRVIINRLANSDVEALNLLAYEIDRPELKQMMRRAGTEPEQVSHTLCYRYGLDAVIFVKINVNSKTSTDGYFRAHGHAYIDAYDNARKPLGIMGDKDVMMTKADPESAVWAVEKELGQNIATSILAGVTHLAGTRIENRIELYPGRMTLKLEGANSEELVEVFGKVVNTVRGIKSAKMINQQLVPKHPEKCFVTWRVRINPSKTDAFRLKTNINKIINDILDAGGDIDINGVSYRYTVSQVKMLQGFRSAKLTPTSIVFVIDPDRASARDLSDHHDPENDEYFDSENEDYPQQKNFE